MHNSRLLMVAFLLVGCGSGASENPVLLKAVAGTDRDQNGVRDDIDRLIEEKYGENQRRLKAVRQKARAFQRAMELKDFTRAKEVAQDMSRSTHCTIEIFRGISQSREVSRWLESEMINTPERVHQYLKFNRALSGKLVGGYPGGAACDWVR